MDQDFEVYVVSRRAALLRTAYLLCGDHAQAEDVVQTALARLHLAWPRLDRRDSLDGYVRRALVNETRSGRRRPWARREQPAAEVPDRLAPASGPEVAEPPDVRDALWQAVCRLPPRQRAVIVLRYYEDLSEAEIADALGVAPGTVKSQASKAMATLRGLAALDPVLREDPR